MQAGTVIILNDVIGVVQSWDGESSYEVLCPDDKIRELVGDVTEVANPHALALLVYNKLLERINK